MFKNHWWTTSTNGFEWHFLWYVHNLLKMLMTFQGWKGLFLVISIFLLTDLHASTSPFHYASSSLSAAVRQQSRTLKNYPFMVRKTSLKVCWHLTLINTNCTLLLLHTDLYNTKVWSKNSHAHVMWLVMGLSQDSALTRLWLGIFWPTRTRFC